MGSLVGLFQNDNAIITITYFSLNSMKQGYSQSLRLLSFHLMSTHNLFFHGETRKIFTAELRGPMEICSRHGYVVEDFLFSIQKWYVECTH